jgi:arylsulfatase A-like enzyme
MRRAGKSLLLFATIGGLLAIIAISRNQFPLYTGTEHLSLVLGWAARACVLGLVAAGLNALWASLVASRWLVRLGFLLTAILVLGASAFSYFGTNIQQLQAPFSTQFLEKAFGTSEYVDLPSDKFAEDAPNIVLVSVETTRRDSMSLYGYERSTTPWLDGYAEGGTVFENAFSQAPATARSVASLITGLYPYSIDAEFERREKQKGAFISSGFHTLAERLRAAGYATVALVSNSRLNRNNGYGQGFDFYDDQQKLSQEEVVKADGSRDIIDRAVRRLDPLQAPFFLWVHLPDPHHPYSPANQAAWEDSQADQFAEYQDQYVHSEAGKITQAIRSVPDLSVELREAHLAYLKGRYDSEILAVDKKIQRLLDALVAHGYDEANTLFIVLADHGEEFLDHGDTLHSHTLYDELVHVPLLMRGPGVPAGRRVEEVVELVDVSATILEAAGVSREGVDGASLFELLSRAGTVSAEATEPMAVSVRNKKYISLRTASRKIIVAYEPYVLDPISWAPWHSLGEMVELAFLRDRRAKIGYWDLVRDPDEQENRLGDSLAEARVFYDRLLELQKAHPIRDVSAESNLGLTPEELEALRSLGYTE